MTLCPADNQAWTGWKTSMNGFNNKQKEWDKRGKDFEIVCCLLLKFLLLLETEVEAMKGFFVPLM